MKKFAKILVGNLVSEADEAAIVELFTGTDGTVVSVVVPSDEKGKGKGYAFVQMGSQLEAEQAILTLDGALIRGRRVCLSLAESETIKRRRKWYKLFVC